MLGHHHHQPPVAPPPSSPLDSFNLMSQNDLALILKDPEAVSQFIARLTDAHAENAATRNTKPQLYKTEMCHFWEEHGTCRRHKCWFAHGKEELRNPDRHPKYKTKVCQTFSKTGRCGYGQRCVYIHPRYSAGLHPGSINTTADASQALVNANGGLSGLLDPSSSVWHDVILAAAHRSSGLSGAGKGQENKQIAGNTQQINLSDLQNAAQQSVLIPSTPSYRSREPMATPMSSSPDSLLSSSSTMVMTPTTAVSHSPTSSTSSTSGKYYALPPWRIEAKPLKQPNFDDFKNANAPHAIPAKQSPPRSGKEAVEDVFYSPNGFDQQRQSQSWKSTVKGQQSSPGSSVQQTNPPMFDDIVFDDIFKIGARQANPSTEEDIFMIEH
ncbi:uncharacterized protein FA14DRAFT_157191 [Meira miltonrushii]|uniref:C3H1-type domain-containing protein n=1 Tax=Meira miltonrushii TaxID=1280837 RepID=A0A316V5H1_9BASI|nr:uncharacterized protein FA14DRAFT_157191 [Meira miltonrushii]PWN32474.1 hypothetical protein FA14DRAFT_157191 [Meira miltonrushii]